jgi:hypothetical protein
MVKEMIAACFKAWYHVIVGLGAGNTLRDGAPRVRGSSAGKGKGPRTYRNNWRHGVSRDVS